MNLKTYTMHCTPTTRTTITMNLDRLRLVSSRKRGSILMCGKENFIDVLVDERGLRKMNGIDLNTRFVYSKDLKRDIVDRIKLRDERHWTRLANWAEEADPTSSTNPYS